MKWPPGAYGRPDGTVWQCSGAHLLHDRAKLLQKIIRRLVVLDLGIDGASGEARRRRLST
jgi:hypothetical protein